MSTPNRPEPGRIHAVDAVRGFALAGVAAVHMLEQYMGAPMPEEQQQRAMAGLTDQIVMGLDFTFLMGKFYVLFSLLFGLSFFIQMDRAARRGLDFRARFAWRLAILFAIGFVHHLFYRADILTTYAVLGLLLIPGYRFSSAWLLGLAAALFLGTGRFASFATLGPAPIPGVDMSPAAEWVSTYWNTLTQGSLWDVMSLNALGAYPPLLNFQFGIFGRGYVTLGLFFLGLWVGRQRLVERVADDRRLVKRGMGIAAMVAVASLVATGATFAVTGPPPEDFDSWGFAIAMTAMDVFNLAVGAIWLFAFLWASQRRWGAGLFDLFAPYGRMALTNYVCQGVLGAFVYYGWGFGRLGEWRAVHAALAAPAFIGLGLIGSRLWLRHFQYGPLEWLWRSATYMKVFPLRRGPAATQTPQASAA